MLPASSPQAVIKTAVFLEIFSGEGGLSKAVNKWCGHNVLLRDIRHGPEYDLRSPAKRRLICEWIRGGSILGLHLSPPCASFSHARDAPPGPPPLRSDSRPLGPLGLPGLAPGTKWKVEQGNLFMRFSARVLGLCWQHRVPATLEHPACSRLWMCPPIQALRKKPHVTIVDTHYCAWGKPFKKPTAFLGIYVALDRVGARKCLSKRICHFTQRPHVPLQGHRHDGTRRSGWGQPYPATLCKGLAKCFYDF